MHEPVDRNRVPANRDKVHPVIDENPVLSVCIVWFASRGALEGARRPGHRRHDNAL